MHFRRKDAAQHRNEHDFNELQGQRVHVKLCVDSLTLHANTAEIPCFKIASLIPEEIPKTEHLPAP